MNINTHNQQTTRLWWRKYIAVAGMLVTIVFSCKQSQKLSEDAIAALAHIHAELEQSSLDSMAFWLGQAASIQAQFEVPDSLRAQTFFYRGNYLHQLGQLDSAATLYHNALSLIQPPLSRRESEYFRMAWRVYNAQGEYGECLAISNTLESLLDADATAKQKALLYFIRESAYRQQENYEQAMDYNQRQIEQLKLAGDTEGLASALNSKAIYAYYVEQDVDKTFAILDTLVKGAHQYSHDINRLIYGDYGIYLFYEGRYEEALHYYTKGLAEGHLMEDQSNQHVVLATAYSNIAEVHMQLGDYERAQIFLDSVHYLGLYSIPEDVRNNTLRYQLELIYRDQRGLTPIMGALDSILWYQDQQFLERNTSELKALQLANEKEKALLEKNKQEELENLRLRSRQTLLLVVFGIVVWVGYLLYRQRQLRFEKQELQLHQRLLRTQMNPHFTFNTLYAIQNLIKKDPKKAVSYQLKFSRLLRLILNNSTANYVQLDDELTAVEKYLELQLLRFPEKFSYEITLDGIERDSLVFIPPMLMQPMIENCIEHGFAGIDYVGLINIRLAKKGSKFLFCAIEDNGLGMNTEEVRNSRSKSTDLIDTFLKKLTPNGLKVTNKATQTPGSTGVLVEFLIPLKSTANG